MTGPSACQLRDGITEITVLSQGCAVQDWRVDGQRVVLGYADPKAYLGNPKSMGIIVGRVANRISGAGFDLDGVHWPLPANSGPNHIHGGPGGLGWRDWTMVQVSDRAVRLEFLSPHLDQGYPGTVRFCVHMTLQDGTLRWEMEAHPDRVTPVNLAQHLYFNLHGSGSIRDHTLRIDASRCTPTGAGLLPTGEILDVQGTRFDFRMGRSIEAADPDSSGYDLNYLLDRPGTADPQVRVEANGLALTLSTDRPGVQLYTSNSLTRVAEPHPGQDHGAFGGLCLEAQDLPNALNQPGFGSILCAPDKPYRQVTSIRILPC